MKQRIEEIIENINTALKDLEKYAKKHNLPIIIKKVKPIVKETFFSLLLGKGYQLPSTLRWCTDRLKLRPQNRLSKEYIETFPNGIIAVVGSRKEESKERSDRLDSQTIDGIYKVHAQKNWNMIAPIEKFSTDEVWQYLFDYSSDWIDSSSLAKVYEEAADDGDECRTTLEGESGNKAGCGKSARYGCWICPKVFSKDKALINLSKTYSYMKKQEVYRNWIIDAGQGWKNRRPYRNDNQGIKIYDKGNHRDGIHMPSGYTLEFRIEMLEKLWILNSEISEARGGELISQEELSYIQNEWLKEGDLDLTVQKIIGYELKDIDLNLLKLAKKIQKLFCGSKQEKVYKKIPFLKSTISSRFITTLIIELDKNKKTEKEIVEFFKNLLINSQYDEKRLTTYNEFKTMKTYIKKFFPSEALIRVIKKEWEDDKISFYTFAKNNLQGTIINPDNIDIEENETEKQFKKRLKAVTKEYNFFREAILQYEEYASNDFNIKKCISISDDEKELFLNIK